jgi:molybdate transport system substrate-binding protein
VLTRKSILAAIAATIAIASVPFAAQAQDKSITVFAAASMKNALDDVDAAFTKQSGIKVVASYDASSALMKQIEGGAPADVFVSADLKWMDYGAQKKLIKDDTRVNLLGNTLVLIAPKDSKIDKVTIAPGFDLAKLAGDGRIATGDVKAVPVGIYAQAALEKLGVFPEDSHDPIIYPVAATTSAKPDVTPYLAFLRSQAAKTIFESYGFAVLMKPTS